MGNWWDFSYVLLFFLSFSYAQTNQYITQPTLTSVTPINSTALTITWQFADSAYDASDLIRVYINIFEFYYGYTSTSWSSNYTFTTNNKTITSLTQNFQLVNAFYYVCFSSNSTITNSSNVLYRTQCRLTRTCSRSNSTSCPQTSFVTILPTTISSTSFIVTVYWLNKLPYVPNSTVVQLISENLNGTLTGTTSNDTYTMLSYSFSNRQPKTSYLVSTIITYTILSTSQTEIYNLTVTTSRSSNLIYISDIFLFGALIFSIKFY